MSTPATRFSQRELTDIWINALNIAGQIHARAGRPLPRHVPRLVAEQMREGRWPSDWRPVARAIAIVMLGGRLS